jgi:large subunit ribosomal protein L19
MSHKILDIVAQKYMKSDPPKFRIGDTVAVHVKIREGEKERIQRFVGVVIARKGRGVARTFTVRRIVANQGVERIFMLHSPLTDKIEVLSSGKVRRAKLYYLRDRVGKARKLKKKNVGRKSADSSEQAGPEQAAPDNSEPVLAAANS